MVNDKVTPKPSQRQMLAAGVIRAKGDPRPSYTAEACQTAVVRITRHDPEPDYVPFRDRMWDADSETFRARPFPQELI